MASRLTAESLTLIFYDNKSPVLDEIANELKSSRCDFRIDRDVEVSRYSADSLDTLAAVITIIAGARPAWKTIRPLISKFVKLGRVVHAQMGSGLSILGPSSTITDDLNTTLEFPGDGPPTTQPTEEPRS